MLLDWKISSNQSDDYYDEIQDLFNRQSVVQVPKSINKTFMTYSLSDTLNGIGSGIEFVPQDRLDYFEEMIVKLNRIKAIAAFPEQVYGWIKMDNTIIDYPILKAADNDYYLRRLPNGKNADSGSIFADYRGTDIHIDNRHVVLYGHNRADGSMFTQLKYLFWPSKDYDQYKNARIELITEDGIYTYKIFSIYTATTGNNYIKYELSKQWYFLQF
jgi:sortase B